MNKRITFAMALILACSSSVFAQDVTIKLGSLAPKGSLWAVSLERLQSQWAKISGGTVAIKIYSGGSVGDELDMIRKMRIGQLNASALTIFGLNRIYTGTYALTIPRFVRTLDEFKYLLSKMKTRLDAEYKAKGFKVMLWSDTGWVYLFSRKPVVTPVDLKPQKVYVNEKSTDVAKAWSKMGFTAVPLNEIDIVLQLQTGGIDSIITSPFYIVSYYLYETTNNMLDLPWAPFIGALVISLDTWNKIPVDLQALLEKSSESIVTDMDKEWIAKEKEAIAAMKKNGLSVNTVSQAQVKEWDTLIGNGYKEVLGDTFDRKFYDEARLILEEYRKKKAAGK
jgi:TRAP-type C4-dicarboxylate transport system substrate-binding protein